MINFALRSEYSFKKCFAFVKDLVAISENVVGIADENNTFSHYKLQKFCKEYDIKPLFGVRLMVVPEIIAGQKQFGPFYSFTARNQGGLAEIYWLVRRSYEQFYYHPIITHNDINNLSDNVIVVSHHFADPTRIDLIALNHFTSPKAFDSDIPKVAVNYNWYIKSDDREVYELHSSPRFETQTYPQYILNRNEWLQQWKDQESAIENGYLLAESCEHFELASADPIKYKGRLSLMALCKSGARRHKIDLNDPKYKARLEHEIVLIEKQNFTDYFLIVSDMIRKAKRNMLVGPSRGSSAGSLVCFLMGITEVDPIKFDLLFERFIDEQRKDLPDIDIDFPDSKRDKVIKNLVDIYGEDKVSHISTISTMKPKSALGKFSEALSIPKYELDDLKASLISRSSGDARAQQTIMDTFVETDIGKSFLETYPRMKLVEKIEAHASHAGVHAGGIIISNNRLTEYGGVNVRTDTLMMDKSAAEDLNLLKIDCLGLRTLSILEDVADQVGMKYSDFYKLPLDDQPTFDIFNDMRLDGIFQFQGQALQYVTRQMGVKSFDDVAAITALARPGPIHSGGTNIFVSRHSGEKPVEYLSQDPSVVRSTEATLGVIIYQEQIMSICREYGGLSWVDVQILRRAMGKSKGEEFFNRYKEEFVAGAVKRGMDADEADNVWSNLVTFGSWGFNKGHAYAYGLISYWTAWCKAHHPLEFTVANLNHARGDDTALRILRDAVNNDGIEYEYFDPDNSQVKWSISGGKLLGGLTTIRGVGPRKANDIINARKGKRKWTNSMVRLLNNPITQFTILYPAHHFWKDLYDDPESVGLENSPVNIDTVEKPGEYLIIGKLIDLNLRDLNETASVVKRGGKIIEDHTKFLNLIMEDDSGSIVCTINRYKYDSIGANITETAREGIDWFLIKGNIKDKWRRVDVTQILNLTRWREESLLESEKN